MSCGIGNPHTFVWRIPSVLLYHGSAGREHLGWDVESRKKFTFADAISGVDYNFRKSYFFAERTISLTLHTKTSNGLKQVENRHHGRPRRCLHLRKSWRRPRGRPVLSHSSVQGEMCHGMVSLSALMLVGCRRSSWSFWIGRTAVLRYI
jgi:hypothetical protein